MKRKWISEGTFLARMVKLPLPRPDEYARLYCLVNYSGNRIAKRPFGQRRKKGK